MSTDTSTIDRYQLHQYIFIGEMLRRHESKFPGSLAQFRSEQDWAKIISRRATLDERNLRPESFDIELHRFLRAGDNRMGSSNPWSISRRVLQIAGDDRRSVEEHRLGLIRTTAEYLIGRVRTLGQDLAFVRDVKIRDERSIRQGFAERHGFDYMTEDISDL